MSEEIFFHRCYKKTKCQMDEMSFLRVTSFQKTSGNIHINSFLIVID